LPKEYNDDSLSRGGTIDENTDILENRQSVKGSISHDVCPLCQEMGKIYMHQK